VATYFSDHFSTGANQTAVDRAKRPPGGVGGGVLMYKRASAIPTDTADGDIIRMITMLSSDRIIQIFYSSTAGGAGTVDIGLYAAGDNHDGAVIDDDVFASAIAVTAAVARTDEFIEAATLEDQDRGKQLWQLVDEGAGTYTTDPFEQWDICFTLDTGTTTASAEFTLEVLYTTAV